MTVKEFDLTSGFVRVYGNDGDRHTFRLSNPTGEQIIQAGAVFEAEFESALKTVTPVELDISQVADGILLIPITIESGKYRVRLTNPQQTILTVEVIVK